MPTGAFAFKSYACDLRGFGEVAHGLRASKNHAWAWLNRIITIDYLTVDNVLETHMYLILFRLHTTPMLFGQEYMQIKIHHYG